MAKQQDPDALGDPSSPVPLYHRIYILLREQIVSGAVLPGEKLPSETTLMQQYAVSRITVGRALTELADEGLVTRARGRGTVVSSHPASRIGDQPIIAGVDGLMANLAIVGRQTSVVIHAFDFVPATRLIAGELGIKCGTRVHRAVRGRSLHGKPFSLSTSHVLEDIALTFEQQDMVTTPLIDLVTRSGRHIDHVTQHLTATLAGDVDAQRLQVPVASPLLKIRRQFFDTSMRCCFLVELLYPPARFEYRMTLTRGSDDDKFRPGSIEPESG